MRTVYPARCPTRIRWKATVAAVFGLSAGPVTAQTVQTATAVDSGNWSSSAIWATTPTPGLIPNNVPGVSTFDVFVTDGRYVTLDINATVRNLTLGYSGGGLSNTIDGSGNLTVLGNFDWGNGVMGGTGTTTVAGAIQLGASALSRVLNADGATSGSVSIDGGTWNNRAGAIYTLNATDVLGDGIILTNGGRFNNLTGATLRKTGAEETRIQSVLSGDATMFHNAGTIDVQAGTLSLALENGTNAGSIVVGAGATLNQAGNNFVSGTFTHTGSLTGAGSVVFSGVTTTFSAGSTFGLTGAVTIEGNNSARVNFNQAATLSSLTMTSGAYLGGSAAVTITGGLTGAGMMDGIGTTTVAGPITGNFTIDRTLNADGVTTVQSGMAVGTNGTWNNRAGAVFVMAPGINDSAQLIVGDTLYSGGVFNNLAGAEFRKDGAGSLDMGYGGGTFNNAGTFNVRAGVVRIGGNLSGTNSGLMTVATGTTLDIHAGGGIVNTGTIRVTGGTLTDRGGEGSVGSYNAIDTRAGTIDVQAGAATLSHLSSFNVSTGGDRFTKENYYELPGTFKAGPNGSIVLGQLGGGYQSFPEVPEAGLPAETLLIQDVIGSIPVGRGLTLNGPGSFVTGTDGTLFANAGTLEVLGGRNFQLHTTSAASPGARTFFNTGTLRIGSTLAGPSTVIIGTKGLDNGIAGDIVLDGGKLVGQVVNRGGIIRGMGILEGDLVLDATAERNHHLGTESGPDAATDRLTVTGDLTAFGKAGTGIYGQVLVSGTTRVTSDTLLFINLNSTLGGAGNKVVAGKIIGYGTVAGAVTLADGGRIAGFNDPRPLKLLDTLGLSSGAGNITGNVSVAGLTTVSGGTLTVDTGATFGGAGAIAVTGGTLVNNGTISKPVSFTGSGRLSGVYAGQVAIADGTVDTTGGLGAKALSIGGNTTLGGGAVAVEGTTTFAPGTINLNSSLVGDGDAELLAATRALVTGNTKFGGTVTQAGVLNVGPTGTLDANAYKQLINASTIVDGRLVSQAKADIASPFTVGVTGTAELRGGGTISGTTKVSGALNSMAPVVVSQVAVTLDGTWTGANPAAVDPATAGLVLNNAQLQGIGVGTVAVAVGSGSTVSPGKSPGKLTLGNTLFQPGSKYVVEFRDAGGAAGVGYDQLVVNGGLTNTGTSVNPMIFDLTTLDAANNPGQAAFDPSQSYTWRIASVTGEVTGFTEGTYRIDTSHFQNNYVGGVFDLWATSGNGLILSYTLAPVPEPASVLGVAAAGLGLAGWVRRRVRAAA